MYKGNIFILEIPFFAPIYDLMEFGDERVEGRAKTTICQDKATVMFSVNGFFTRNHEFL